MGCDGSYAKLREVRNEKLLLNWEAWNAVDKVEKSEWYTHLATVGHLTKAISDPRISSWNVGPHGFRGGREKIFALFEIGDPIICLQDLRIPENKVDAVKSELHAVFSHYWIYISTAISNGATNQDERGRPYRFTTLTALDSHYLPSATHLSLHPGSSKGPKREGTRKPPTAGRSVDITTKNGGELHVINLYQFTANDRGEQDVIWGLNFWISRHPGERVILIGDMNGSIPGGSHNYAHPMEKNLVEADVRLAKFRADSEGTLSSPTEHT